MIRTSGVGCYSGCRGGRSEKTVQGIGMGSSHIHIYVISWQKVKKGK